MPSPIGLFGAYGIEIELMIVDSQTLNITPIADHLLTDAAISASSTAPARSAVAVGEISDFEDGKITWSNELVNHVIEFKTTGPEKSLANLEAEFFRSQRHAAALLAARGARLMPTGMHPWMNPNTETVLWPHDNNEIYSLYNKIFDCRGHGWSNLQSVHINLPFKNESEFKRLHSAIRLLLPIIPALTASTPFAEGRATGVKDTRLAHYETNQARLPIIAGEIIPTAIEDYADYRKKITDPIQTAIRPFDSEGLLQGDWLNSRGAIARIDRGTIEIRLVDTQECTHADLTIVKFIVAALRAFITNDTLLNKADALNTTSLYKIWKACIQEAESAKITDQNFFTTLFPNLATDQTTALTAQNLWQMIFKTYLQPTLPTEAQSHPVAQLPADDSANSEGQLQYEDRLLLEDRVAFEKLVARPSLATRLLTAAGSNPTLETLKNIYAELCNCLDKNELFDSTKFERSNSLKRESAINEAHV